MGQHHHRDEGGGGEGGGGLGGGGGEGGLGGTGGDGGGGGVGAAELPRQYFVVSVLETENSCSVLNVLFHTSSSVTPNVLGSAKPK